MSKGTWEKGLWKWCLTGFLVMLQYNKGQIKRQIKNEYTRFREKFSREFFLRRLFGR